MKIDRILVVCVGNICRSPFGEKALQSFLPNVVISSAGISALVDKGVPDIGLRVGQQYADLNLLDHKARQLTLSLIQENDLILVMEPRHIDAVCRLDPSARGKTLLFGQWLNHCVIPDPYRQQDDAFKHAYDLLWLSAEQWSRKFV
jgi:protein-tyrosine phosphatase